MNKKVIKYILIISVIVLLLGLGIWGYKYIKNRNVDRKTNESENELKQLENLTSINSGSVGGYTLNYYYNGPFTKTSCELYSNLYGPAGICYDYYLTIYVNNSIKLKSSWNFYSSEAYSNSYITNPNAIPNFTPTLVNDNFLIISIPRYIRCSSSGAGSCRSQSKFYYPYTKVFDVRTGDMIFAVPTNSNEKITISSTFDGISCSNFSNNMYLRSSSAIYYLKSNYTLTNGHNVEVHKVVFGDSYTNKYNDTTFGTTTGTITLNS